jgi:uncharacterized protein involved in exopolysaccharide biosynthesis
MRDTDYDSPADTTIDLGRLRAAIRAARARIAVAAVLAAGLAAGVAILTRAPATVETRVAVQSAMPREATAGDRLRHDDEIVAAQIALVGSNALLRRVATTESAAVSALFGDAGAGPAADRDGGTPEERRTAALRDRLVVERVDRTRLVALRLAAADPAAAARVLTAVAGQWSAATEEARVRARVELTRRHAPAVEAARRRLAEAEQAAAEPPIAEVAAGGRAELIAARDAAETKLKRFEILAASGETGAERAVDEGLTETMRDLRDRRTALRTRLAQLSTVYLGNHPLMKEAEADAAELRHRIRAELPRALTVAKAERDDLDRRLAEAAAETTASVPAAAPVDLEPLRVALAEAEARREAAVAEGLAEVAVEIRPLGAPVVVAASSPWRTVAAAVVGGLLALLLAVAWIGLAAVAAARRAARTARPRCAAPLAQVFEPVAEPAPAPTADLAPASVFDPAAERPAATATPRESEPAAAADAAPAPRPAAAVLPPLDAEALDRAGRYRAAAAPIVAGLWRAITAELPDTRRVVVISTRDAAWSRGASEALVSIAARDREVGRVALCDARPDDAETGDARSRDERPGLTDFLDGAVTWSELMWCDPATGVWSVPAGARDLTEADLADPQLAGLFEAMAVTWDVTVVDAGRLEGREGVAALLERADAIVLAEDDTDDPRVLRVAEVLTLAGCPTWILDAPLADAGEWTRWADAA